MEPTNLDIFNYLRRPHYTPSLPPNFEEAKNLTQIDSLMMLLYTNNNVARASWKEYSFP